MVKAEYLREKGTFTYMGIVINGFRDGSGGDPPWDIISWLVLNQKVEKSKERSNRQQRPCLALMSSLLAYGGRGLALMLIINDGFCD